MPRLKKRSDGRYCKQIYLGKKDTGRLDENGDPIYKKEYHAVYGFSPREVDEKAAQLRVQLGKGIDIKAANDSFSLWAERYRKSKEAEGQSASHLNNIQINIRHLSALSSIPISKINKGDIQAIIDSLAGWHNGKPPMAKRSLRGVRQTASAIFKTAMASRVIEYNPAEFVTIPKGASASRREAIPQHQQRWIEETPHRAQRAAMIMLYAGLRRGEVLALTWADVDFTSGTIRVNKAVEYVDGKPIAKDKTKTPAGMRTVDMPRKLRDFLQAEHRKDDCLYIVHSSNGSIPSASGWKRLWESYMKALNLKYGYTSEEREKRNINSRMHPEKLTMRIETFTPHQLRHTCATLMYLAGMDALQAKEQLGHRDIATTLGIYTHLEKKHKRKGIAKLDSYLDSSETVQAHS